MSSLNSWILSQGMEGFYEVGTLEDGIQWPLMLLTPDEWKDLYYKTEIEIIILDQMIKEALDAEVPQGA